MNRIKVWFYINESDAQNILHDRERFSTIDEYIAEALEDAGFGIIEVNIKVEPIR